MTEKPNIGFKKIPTKLTRPTDPESLFRDLKNRKIEHLWSHQADVLREYHQKYLRANDVSLELPTGTGKTLIGLLLGLYRMKAFDERVLYLCPTRQLAHQAYNQAQNLYDIKAHLFVGSKRDYSPRNYSEYSKCEAIAISTYSGLFNIKPGIDNPNIIVLDDAHAGGGYISLMWSVEINRYAHKDLFLKIISLLEDKISRHLVDIIKDDTRKETWRQSVEMLLAPYFWESLDNLRELLDENISSNDPNLFFPWATMREHLEACNLFISWSEILIRPWIPPSLSHEAFSNATQRIYMSATLGTGGELERIIGVKKIERIPAPPGWDKQGQGRRFFIFPDSSFNQSEYSFWLAKIVEKRDRTLILCPDNMSAIEIEDTLRSRGSTKEFLKSGDIEESLATFTSHDNAVLILTNRYDGIDLPKETCRQLIIYELPGATNIQERFLLNRLGISSLLKDRIRTRITQASGRCTRGATDYSLIIPVGKQLFKFCITKENQKEFHPELQAELIFGINQSDVPKIEHLSALIDLFFEQSKEWKEAEKQIEEIRSGIAVKADKLAETYYSIVKEEVSYQYYLWNKNYEKALISARNIVDKLSGDDFAGYRALWHYFVGNIGWKSGKTDITAEFYKKAEECSTTVSWFSGLDNILKEIGQTKNDVDLLSGYAIENIQSLLDDLGSSGPRFERKIKEFQNNIGSNEPNKFDLGLTQLGKMMGFSAMHPEGTATPDSVWGLSDKLLLLFEAKSDESEEDGISISTCRQASGHYDWTKGNEYDKFENKICIVVSPRKYLDESAVLYSENLFYLNVSRVREIFAIVEGILRRIRSLSGKYGEEKVRLEIFKELTQCKLDPNSFVEELKRNALSKLKHTS